MSIKYPNYVNLTSSSEEQPNERTPSLPPRKKSISPPQAPSKSISSKSTHYTSSSSPCEYLTPTHVAPPPKLHFVILIKQEPQELPPLQISPNDPYAQTMDNWPPGPSNPSPPLHNSQVGKLGEWSKGWGGGERGGEGGDEAELHSENHYKSLFHRLGRATATPRGGRTGGRTGRGWVGRLALEVDQVIRMESVQDMMWVRDTIAKDLRGRLTKVVYPRGYWVWVFIGKALVVNSQIYTRGRRKPHVVGAGHATYTDRFHELARLVPHSVTPENKRIESKDRNGRDDNKRTRTRNAFATTANPVRREYMGTVPKCTTCNFHYPPETPCHTCFNCNHLGHFAKDCKVVPRNVNPINARNPTDRACYECGSTDYIKATCPRLNQAQRSGGNHQNQVVAVNRVSLNNHYATTLFNFGVDYSFVSTTFIPLLGMEPSDLGFSYKLKIARGHLVEIDKVIKGCKLEIEDHVFDIN
ncbi:putative reverse transcriptase domain-containing protein, partial [Tanacetum coccineum]